MNRTRVKSFCAEFAGESDIRCSNQRYINPLVPISISFLSSLFSSCFFVISFPFVLIVFRPSFISFISNYFSPSCLSLSFVHSFFFSFSCLSFYTFILYLLLPFYLPCFLSSFFVSPIFNYPFYPSTNLPTDLTSPNVLFTLPSKISPSPFPQ